MWTGIGMGVAALGGAVLSSNAAKSAAGTQAGAAGAGIGEQAREFDLTRADTAPYRASGSSALQQLQTLLGMPSPDAPGDLIRKYIGRDPNQSDYAWINEKMRSGATIPDLEAQVSRTDEAKMASDQGYQIGSYKPAPQVPSDPNAGALTRKFSVSDFWNDPVVQASYQSGLDLGTKALKNAAPLTTGLDSGAAMKELTKFGTDYTGNMAAGSQARYVGDQNNQFNKLAALAGVGQTGVGQSAAAGTNTSNNISSTLTSQGNAAGAAKIAGANAWGGGLQSVANWWNGQNMLNQLTARNGSTMPSTFDWTGGSAAGGPAYG